MYPEKPINYDPRSAENIMFDALNKLPDDYHVFYSTDIQNVKSNKLIEHEVDFIVFHKNKGILCIEAKNGTNIVFENNEWFIGKDKKLMKHGGPFKQAQMNKIYLIDIMQERLPQLKSNCKFMHAVWFPAFSQKTVDKIFPIGADKDLLLTNEALYEPQKYIDKIFEIKNEYGITTKLSGDDAKKIISKLLCPTLNLCETGLWNRTVFNKLLQEQINVLDFLEEQKSALINGAAGTGKTFVALEKAKRCGEAGEKVLFLCFNKRLSEFLNRKYQYENVVITHIDKFACRICKTQESDLQLLNQIFNDDPDKFEFNSLIIDEGQDFGQERIENSGIIQTMKTIVDMNDGHFYVFYDKNQLIQGNKIPDYIRDADCKLTLYKNCRNTENIAITASRVFDNFKIKLNSNIRGNSVNLYIDTDMDNCVIALSQLIKKYKNQGYEDIKILTCANKEENSFVYPYTDSGYFEGIELTTCRKFKGLEAEVVILTDIDINTFLNKSESLIFYTGSSRAKYELSVIANLSENDCKDLMNFWQEAKSNRNIFNLFATKINASLFKIEI